MFTKIKLVFVITIFALSNQIAVLGMEQTNNTQGGKALFVHYVINKKLQSDFLQKFEQLKASDGDSIVISDNDFATITKLWNNIVSHTSLQLEEMDRVFQKKVKCLSHPDKYQVLANKAKMNEFFTELTATKKCNIVFPVLWQDLSKASKKEVLLQNLKDALDCLKTEDNYNHNLITDANVAHVKDLWDAFKLEHNYTLFDRILCWNNANANELAKIRKTKSIALSLHSDQYSPQNRPQMDDLFKYLGDTSKPITLFDEVVNTVAQVTSPFTVQQLDILGFCFLNKVCPRIFRSRANEKMLSSFDKETKSLADSIKRKERIIHHKYNILKTKISLMKNRRS